MGYLIFESLAFYISEALEGYNDRYPSRTVITFFVPLLNLLIHVLSMPDLDIGCMSKVWPGIVR